MSESLALGHRPTVTVAGTAAGSKLQFKLESRIIMIQGSLRPGTRAVARTARESAGIQAQWH